MVSLVYILIIIFLIIVRLYQKKINKIKQVNSNIITEISSHENQINIIIDNHNKLNSILDNISNNKEYKEVKNEKIG